MSVKILPYEQLKYKDGEIGVNDVSVEYIQDSDCTEEEGNVQTITISSRNNGTNRFINIKTDNWSISDIDELEEIISDFKKRADI